MASHHSLLTWKTAWFRVPLEYGLGGKAQHMCNTRNNNPMFNHSCTDRYCCLDLDFRSYSPEVQAKMMENMRKMISRRIHSTRTDPAMAQPYNAQHRFDEDILDYVPEVLIAQPNNFLDPLCSFVSATRASRWFPAVLPMGGSAAPSTSQPVPCSNSNSNSNDIINMTTIGNTGLVNWCMIVVGAMSLGG
jgi:hypothetical protein